MFDSLCPECDARMDVSRGICDRCGYGTSKHRSRKIMLGILFSVWNTAISIIPRIPFLPKSLSFVVVVGFLSVILIFPQKDRPPHNASTGESDSKIESKLKPKLEFEEDASKSPKMVPERDKGLDNLKGIFRRKRLP